MCVKVYEHIYLLRSMDRPDNDEYFMEMAALVSKRSTCMRRRVGAVIVVDKRVISHGIQRFAERHQALRGTRVHKAADEYTVWH